MKSGVIGKMRSLVTLYKAEPKVGDFGQSSYEYTQHSRVFAYIDRSTSEQIDRENFEQSDNVSLTIYKVKGLTTRWRVRIDSTMYEIAAITDRDDTLQVYTLHLQGLL